MITNVITYPSNGTSATGYLAEPDGNGPSMGVVVIQEWWGLNGHIQDVTRRVAGAGAVALAPDLYHGRVTTEPDEARKLRMELNIEQAIKEINKIGVIGFCMGGGLAEQVGARNPQVGAVVSFYGGGAPEASAYTNPSVAVLSIIGEKDTGVLDQHRGLERDLKDSPVTFELVTYPGCDHAFFNDTRPEVYQPGAAQDAWAKAMKWLRTHLQPESAR
jgi:carboxymethylenebutenolidase